MKLALPKAILLDLDDTIIAGESLKLECWERVRSEFAAEIDFTEPGKLIESILEHSDTFWSDPERHRIWRQNLEGARRMIVLQTFTDWKSDNRELAERMADRFSVIREQAIHPFPGAIDTVRRFREEGVGLALITNGGSAPQRRKIQRFGLEELFDHIFIEGEHGFGKPDERIYAKALSALGAEPEDTWMIGDNPIWDVVAPQKLGIRGIWINSGNGTHVAEFKPFMTISKLTEIMKYVE